MASQTGATVSDEMLWHTAYLLMTVVTVVIGFYDVTFAFVFWTVMTLILLPLRPQ